MHVRQQIINAIVPALTGLTTTGANVYSRRTYAVGITPSLNVYWTADDPDYAEAAAGPCKPLRGLEVHVEGFTKVDDEATANAIAEEVEVAMFADDTFGGLAVGTEIGTQEIGVDGDGDDAVLLIDMIFTVFYRVAEGVPHIAT